MTNPIKVGLIGLGEVAQLMHLPLLADDSRFSVAAISDEMVDGIDIMGDADAIAAAMRAYVDAGVESPIVMPLPWGKDRMAIVQTTLEAAKQGAERPSEREAGVS